MVAWLNPRDPFPPVDRALGPESEAPGLLAVSAELPPQQLLIAYRQDILPRYAQDQPVLQWSTDSRMVLCPENFRVSTTFHKTLRCAFDDSAWGIRIDREFRETMVACVTIARPSQHDTWITEDVIQVYTSLHRRGYAHSVEAWCTGKRVGGLYGVVLGRMFYSELIFAHCTDASKIAPVALCIFLGGQGVAMIGCQWEAEHLVSLGGVLMPCTMFLVHVRETAGAPVIVLWCFDKLVLRRWTVRDEQA